MELLALIPQSLRLHALVAACAVCWSASAQARCLGAPNVAIPPSTAATAFTIHTDGTVVARATRLMWARCLVGQSLDNGACTGQPATVRWEDAVSAARLARLGGYSDWRLPNPKELLSIIDDRCAAPSLNADVFPIPTSYFGAWTGTSTGGLTGMRAGAWIVDSNGQTITHPEQASVWLVREAR